MPAKPGSTSVCPRRHHLQRLFVDPQNPATLFVGTMGNPYVRGADRGVYKSTDGGTTWQNVLFVSDQAGASDLVMHPTNPLILIPPLLGPHSQQPGIHALRYPCARIQNDGRRRFLDSTSRRRPPHRRDGPNRAAISQQNPGEDIRRLHGFLVHRRRALQID